MRSILSIIFLSLMLKCLSGTIEPSMITEPNDTATIGNAPDSVSISTKMLDELVVSQKLVSHMGNTDNYVVTKKMLKDVHDTGELLGKIDGAFYNPLSADLTYLGSGNVIILIDSVERDQAYLKRLNPNRLARISVTNHPSGQYSDYDAVINLCTKSTYEGYDGNVLSEIKVRPSHNESRDILSGLRDEVEATYTRDKWNIALSGSYRRINENEGIWYVKDYVRNGYVEEAERPALDKPNKKVVHDDGNINLWVDYRFSKRHSLSLGLNASPGYGKVTQDLRLRYRNGTGDMHEGSYRSADRQRNLFSISPSLNYRGRFGKWQANAYLQYRTTSYDGLLNVEREDFGLTNDRHVSTDYVWAGFDVSRSFFEKLYLSFGDMATFTRFDEKDLHTGDLLSRSSTFRDKLTASLQYSLSPNISFGINAGMTIYHSRSSDDSLDEVSPVLGANFTYSGSKVLLRLNYEASVRYPSLNSLQDYGRFTDSLIFRQGNPALRNVLRHRVNASLTMFRHLTLAGEYTYRDKAIYEIADVGTGMRPDGVTGDYVDYGYRNGDASEWKVNLTFNRTWREAWTLAATATLKGERASYGGQSRRKILPIYDWYLMYNIRKADLQVYLSGALQSDLVVTPQQLGWGRSDGYALSMIKFLDKGKIQIIMMWNMPFHFVNKPYKSVMSSPALVETWSSDSHRRVDNALMFTFVWRFSGGDKTRNYSRKTESVEIF